VIMHISPRCTLRAITMLVTGMMLAISGCASPPEPPAVRTAEAPCPSWTGSPTDHHSNVLPSDLGCVSTVNLQAMVSKAADLEHGRPLGPANGERATLAVEAYQQGKVKGAAQGGSASGSASGGTTAPVGSSTSGSSGGGAQ